MEHTPKNVLIRAVKRGEGKRGKSLEKGAESGRLAEFLHVHTTLQRLLETSGDEKENAVPKRICRSGMKGDMD